MPKTDTENTGTNPATPNADQQAGILDRIWSGTKEISKPAIAGAAGLALYEGGKKVVSVASNWARGARQTAEEAAAGAVKSGGGGYKPF
jgi:hypothetical protein